MGKFKCMPPKLQTCNPKMFSVGHCLPVVHPFFLNQPPPPPHHTFTAIKIYGGTLDVYAFSVVPCHFAPPLSASFNGKNCCQVRVANFRSTCPTFATLRPRTLHPKGGVAIKVEEACWLLIPWLSLGGPGGGSPFQEPTNLKVPSPTFRWGLERRLDVLLPEAGGAYWPLTTYHFPFLEPFPCGGAHRPLTTLRPPSPCVAHPYLPTHPFFSFVGCASGAPKLSLFQGSVSGPHRGDKRPLPLATCIQADTPF